MADDTDADGEDAPGWVHLRGGGPRRGQLGLLAALALPAFLGQKQGADDAAAKSLVRSAATTLDAEFGAAESYAGLDSAAVRAVEPDIVWRHAPGAAAPAHEVSLSAVGPRTYTLASTSASGRVFTLTKDLNASPAIARTCGSGCTW